MINVLDLFGGGGGAAEGYRRVGCSVTMVDVVKRQHLPRGVDFRREDALTVMADRDYLRSFDFIHASPPCQTHTRAKHLRDAQGKGTSKLDLIPETRQLLSEAGVPFVIENVEGAPLRPDLMLCGSMFPELHVHDGTGRRWLKRHRIFELGGWMALQPQCDHKAAGVRALGVYGSKSDNIPAGGQTARTLDEARALMGMPWASWSALVEAIPPAYTTFVAQSFLTYAARSLVRG